MKKLIAIAMAVVFAFGLMAGCNKNEADTGADSTVDGGKNPTDPNAPGGPAPTKPN